MKLTRAAAAGSFLVLLLLLRRNNTTVSDTDKPMIVLVEKGKGRFRLVRDEEVLSFNEVVEAWKAGFGSEFSSMLARQPYQAFYWECPPVTRDTMDTPFEFSIVRSGGFARASRLDFADKIDASARVVSFNNLGGDSTLVVPCFDDSLPEDTYGHVANFCRGASRAQQEELWRTVAYALVDVLDRRGSQRRTWLSTAGGGVPWLHVRFDSRPKYYKTMDYKY